MFDKILSWYTVGMYDSEQIHMMVVGLPWDVQSPRGKGNACYLLCSGAEDSNENRQQFPGMAHKDNLQWGLRSPLHQRKGDFLKEMQSKENQPAQDLRGCSWCTRHLWRLPAMASITSLLTSGSHGEAARRAAKTPPSTAAASHCRVLGRWQGFTKKHLFLWPWSSSLQETANSTAREARKLCEGPLLHKVTTLLKL